MHIRTHTGGTVQCKEWLLLLSAVVPTPKIVVYWITLDRTLEKNSFRNIKTARKDPYKMVSIIIMKRTS